MALLFIATPALVILATLGLVPMLCFYAGCAVVIALDYLDL